MKGAVGGGVEGAAKGEVRGKSNISTKSLSVYFIIS